MQQVKYFCAPIAAPIPKGVFSGTIFFKFKLARKVHLSLMPSLLRYKGVTQPCLRERSSGREDATRAAAGNIKIKIIKARSD